MKCENCVYWYRRYEGSQPACHFVEKMWAGFLPCEWDAPLSEDTAKSMIGVHNALIDNYIFNFLPQDLGYPEGSTEINVGDWLKAMQLIGKQGFYERGHAVQGVLRDNGYDVKMDMQSNKLQLFGRLDG